MKILMFHLLKVSRNLLFAAEGMENLRYLMSVGCFGFLERGESSSQVWLPLARRESTTDAEAEVLTLWDYLREAQKVAVVIGSAPGFPPEETLNPPAIQEKISSCRSQGLANLALLRQVLSLPEWDYCEFHYSFPQGEEEDLRPSYLHFDRELGETAGSLGEDTLVFLLADFAPDGAGSGFIMVAPNNPLIGEQTGKTLEGIAPTLLEMAGYPLPGKTIESSWVHGMELEVRSVSGLTEEEEAILRERLSGLGYI